jgi:hypothetical protein
MNAAVRMMDRVAAREKEDDSVKKRKGGACFKPLK